MAEAPARAWLEADGALLRLRLARPKANVCDAAMVAALRAGLAAHRDAPQLRGVLLDAEGPHFSYGASVLEHLPASCAAMLADLHALILELAGFPVPVLVAVQGQCLGGGLEIALAGGPIFAHPEARFGQPEIQLGVFAPAASCLLPWRVAPAVAEDLLYSGRAIDGADAFRLGLVTALADDPGAAAVAWFEQHLQPRSGSSLRLAVEAARGPRVAALRSALAEVERLYLERLMATHDAVEGLQAFLQKRPARWEHR